MFQGHFPLWFHYVCSPSRLDMKGCWVIGMKWQAEDDVVLVYVIVCGWAVICLGTGNCFVEQASNLIAFVAMGNQAFEKTFVHCSLSSSGEQRVKIRNSVLYTIPGSNPGGWAEWGGGGMYRCKLSRFSNRVVSILFDLLIVMVMSMKLTVFEGSLNSHVSPGNAFIVFLNAFHSEVSRFGFLLGHQIPITLSINCQ